jgi:hypothetical protein
LFSEKRRAGLASHVEGTGAGEVVDAFLHECAAGRMQVQRVAADAALQAARAHGALLEESRSEAALAKGSEGANGVVAEHHYGVGQVDLECGGLEGESAGESDACLRSRAGTR